MAFVVAVAQRKGGAGKSTLAANLAAAFAGLGERVALLDTDPQKTLSYWHAQRSGNAKAQRLDFEAPSGWRVPGATDKYRRSHDVILLDTPPHDDTDARVAIRAADLVLVPLQPSAPDLWAMGATLDIAKAEKRPAALALNRVPAQGRVAEEVAAQLRAKGLTLLDPSLGNRAGFANAFAAGLGVTEAAPPLPACSEELTSELQSLAYL
ncbi:ParA family partition ATPase, partial [Falsiroseomonas oryziterrae]|uniref:ParA family partition ATPase n=1 Tax=Falsiroseomonas oryziterrae TaxID=2911368 RepID=UPI001F1C8737